MPEAADAAATVSSVTCAGGGRQQGTVLALAGLAEPQMAVSINCGSLKGVRAGPHKNIQELRGAVLQVGVPFCGVLVEGPNLWKLSN